MELSDFHTRTLDGRPVDLSDYRGKVVLVVNTASHCGFAPQFEGLEQLWRDYRSRGLVVLGFPSDQFHQELEERDQIGAFCERNWGVDFPLMGLVRVNGPHTDPIFAWLKTSARGSLGDAIKWNFTKFLVARDGRTVRRFAPATKPEALRPAIEEFLAEDAGAGRG